MNLQQRLAKDLQDSKEKPFGVVGAADAVTNQLRTSEYNRLSGPRA